MAIQFPDESRVMYPLMKESRFEGPTIDCVVPILFVTKATPAGQPIHPLISVGTQFQYNLERNWKLDTAIAIQLTNANDFLTRFPVMMQEGKGARYLTTVDVDGLPAKTEIPAVDSAELRKLALVQLWDRTTDQDFQNDMLDANLLDVLLVSAIGPEMMLWRWNVPTDRVFLQRPAVGNPDLIDEVELVESVVYKNKLYPSWDRLLWKPMVDPFFKRFLLQLRTLLEAATVGRNLPIPPMPIPA